MIHALLVFAIFGFAVWIILQLPMPTIFKNIIVGLVAIMAIIYALQVVGVNTGFPRIGFH